MDNRKNRKNTKRQVRLLWILIVLAFGLIEIPGIIWINRIEPRIFGFPFIYGFTLIIWGVLCILLYIGYRLKWGEENENTTSISRKENLRMGK